MRGAEPYIAAALAGLCARPTVLIPEDVAALAVKVGVATARAAAALERTDGGPRVEFRNVSAEGLTEERVREIIAAAFDDFTGAKAHAGAHGPSTKKKGER